MHSFPAALWISGPLHIVWNAFEAAVRDNPRWHDFRDLLSDVLSFLGNKGIRTRFIEKCLCGCQPADRRMFWNWKHSIVDWKWEYMEEIFAKLSDTLDTFLVHFDAAKMRGGDGEAGAGHSVTGIDPKCLKKLELAKRHRKTLVADAEAFNIFSKSVGSASRWFAGCKCHEHIWTADATDAAKAKMFAQEEPGVDHCIWKGRRGSELARGHWRVLAQNVRTADSRRLHLRLVGLPQEVQGSIVHGLDAMKCMWSEEVLAKFAHWSELPHCLLGMWPHDNQAAGMARHAVAKSREVIGTDQERYMHRVAYRIMHPESPERFDKMVERLADNNEMHPDLGVELIAVNMDSTCEQPIEQVHARIHQLNASTGRCLDPPSTSARLRRGQSFHALQSWDCRCFVERHWHTRTLLKDLLMPVMPHSFVDVASRREQLQAVYHCHPQQLFLPIALNKALHKKMKQHVVPPKEEFDDRTRLALVHMKERLPVGTIFSLPLGALPDEMRPAAPGCAVAAGAAAAAGAGAIVPYALGAPLVVETILSDAMAAVVAPPGRGFARKVSASLVHQGIFMVVKTHLQHRFLQSIDLGRRASSIAVVRVWLAGRKDDEAVLNVLHSDTFHHFDLLQLLESQGLSWAFHNLTIWHKKRTTKLALTMPAFGDASASLQLSRPASSIAIGGHRSEVFLVVPFLTTEKRTHPQTTDAACLVYS